MDTPKAIIRRALSMFKLKTATDQTLLLTPILVHEFNFVFELRGVVHVFYISNLKDHITSNSMCKKSKELMVPNIFLWRKREDAMYYTAPKTTLCRPKWSWRMHAQHSANTFFSSSTSINIEVLCQEHSDSYFMCCSNPSQLFMQEQCQRITMPRQLLTSVAKQ